MKVASATTVGLLGGELCLDYANTVEPRHGDDQYDYLAGYPDLVLWAGHAGALSEEEVRRLLRVAEFRPAEAADAFEWALALRETIYRSFSAVAYGGHPVEADLNALTAAHSEALAHYRIAPKGEGFGRTLAKEDGFGRPVWQVSLAAWGPFTGGELDRVKACPVGEGGCVSDVAV